MSNEYFNHTSTITRLSSASSGALNAILSAIAAGFGKLPSKEALELDMVTYLADTGSANSIEIAMTPTLTSYVEGMSVRVKIAETNTGVTSINIDGLGVKAVKRADGTDLEATELESGDIHEFVYDGTNFLMMSPSRIIHERAGTEPVPPDDVAALLASEDVYPEGTYVRTKKEGFSYLVAAAAATDHHVTNAGGTKFYCQRPAGGFDLTQWGVVPDDVTTTATAQAAIDALLETGEQFARLPAGNFIFSQIRLFNSSGGDRAQRGKFTLRGAGSLGHTEVRDGTANGDFYGTRIEIQGDDAADDGILLASGDTTQRRCGLEDLTVIYGGTGYAIDARYVPFLELRNVSVRITAAGSKAINIEDCWGGLLDRFIAIVDKDITSTVHGLRFSATLFSGNFKIRDSIVDRFDNSIWIEGANSFANFVLENTLMQKFQSYGLLCEAPIQNLVLRDEYMEANTAPPNYVKISPASGNVVNFEVDGGLFLGGVTASSWITGPVIDLENVKQAKLSRVRFLNPWGPLVHLRDDCVLCLDGVDASHAGASNLPTGPTYMITAASGFYPKVEMRRSTITDNAKLAWADETAIALSRLDGHGLNPRAGFSRGLLPVTIGLGSAFSISTETVRPMSVLVSATAGAAGAAPVAVRLLPATSSSVEPGTETIVFNSASSTQDVLIRNGPDNTTIATVQPGEVATCYADPDNDQWIVSVSTFSVGP